MSDLLTPAQLQQRMLETSRQVDEALEEFRRAILADVEADRKERIAMNTAMLTAEGTVQERRAKAEKAAESEIFAAALAAGAREAAKEALRARLSQLSAWQSMANTAREEMRLAR